MAMAANCTSTSTPAANLWVSTDGAGAYETLQVLPGNGTNGVKYILTRADQSQFQLRQGLRAARSIVDTNGVPPSSPTRAARMQTSARMTPGIVIIYKYGGLGKLTSIVDRHAGQADVTLVSYEPTARACSLR